jgi:hypothetical protein
MLYLGKMNNQIKRNLLLNTYLSPNSSPYFRRLALSQMNDMKNSIYGGAIPLDLTKEDMHQLIQQYAPIHWLHNDLFNFPVNMEDIFSKFRLEKRGNDDYLIMKESLSSPSATLPWFRGNSDLKNVNTYIFVRPHPKGFALHFNLNFAYNTGKNVLNTRFGNHVFDATQSYIVFDENKQPILLGAQSHSHRPYWQYKNNSSMQRAYDRNNIYQEYEGNHPMFMHGVRGSELYGFKGTKYTYKKTALFKLVDHFNKGYKYDTGNKYVLIMPENYYGLSNIAENQDRQPVDLGIKELEISNWPFQIHYMGADKRGEVKIPFSKSQYRLTGAVHLKPDEFRIQEKRDNIIPTEYLDLKRKELGLKQE